MSRFQTAQMFSLQDPNIFNIAVRGVFDDCQDIVKSVSNDSLFKRKYRIGTVNSINWARIAAQIIYYFRLFEERVRTASGIIAVPRETSEICAGQLNYEGLTIRK